MDWPVTNELSCARPEGVGHGNPDWNTACTVVESEELMAEQRQNGRLARLARDEEGVAGYMLAWFMGVPAGILFLIFLLRGCN